MSRKAIKKEYKRKITATRSRFISLFLIAALGVAFFSGLRACKKDMLMTADSFYDETNLPDIRIISDKGLTDGDIEVISKQDSVSAVEGIYTADVLLKSKESDQAVRLYSLSDKVCTYKVIEGKLPENDNECAVDISFAKDEGLDIGSVMEFESGNDKNIDDSIKDISYTVVGLVSTGRYLSFSRGNTSIGDGSVSGYVVLPAADFVSGVYSEADVLINGADKLKAYSKAYDTLIDSAKDELKGIEASRCEARKTEIVDKMADEFTQRLKQLDGFEDEIENTLSRNAVAFKAKSDTYAKTADNEYAVVSERSDSVDAVYSDILASFDDEEADIKQRESELEDRTAVVKAERDEYDDYVEKLKAISQGPDDIKKILKMKGISEDTIIEDENELKADKKALKADKKALKYSKASVEVRYKDAIESIASEKSQAEYNDEMADFYKKIYKQKTAFMDSYKDVWIAEIEAVKEKISNANDNIDELVSDPVWYIYDRTSIESYDAYKQDADRMEAVSRVFPLIFFIVAALVALTTMTRMVEEERTEIGTLKALGYSKLSIAMIYIKYAFFATLPGAIAGAFAGSKIFPYVVMRTYRIIYPVLDDFKMPVDLFYSVTAGIVTVMITVFAAFVSCLGSLHESPAALMRPKSPKPGSRILLEYIPFIWSHISFTGKATLRNLFRYKKRLLMTIAGIAGAMGLLIVGYGLRDSISVMADRQYKKIILYDAAASIPVTEKNNTSSADSKDAQDAADSTDNLDRLMNMSLADFMGEKSFLYVDATDPYVEKPEVDAEELKNSILGNSENEDSSDSLATYLADNYADDISKACMCSTSSHSVYSSGNKKQAYMYVLEDSGEFNDFWGFYDSSTKAKLTISDDGVFISEKLAELLGVKAGDDIEISVSDTKKATIHISHVIENYISHFVYMTPDYYSKVFGKQPVYNQCLLLLNSSNEAAENALGSRILSDAETKVKSIDFASSYVDSLNDMLKSLNVVIYVLIISAGLLSLIVLYNLININILERKRELATLKVLGFFDREVNEYIFRESFILTIFGILAGAILGKFLHGFVITTCEIDIIKFGRIINLSSYLICSGMTLAFSLIVSLMTKRKIKKIDMTSSLKSVE